jgi:hypothetical protein
LESLSEGISVASLRTRLQRTPLIAILRGISADEAEPIGTVLVEAGIEIIEVPLNSPAPFSSIEKLAQGCAHRSGHRIATRTGRHRLRRRRAFDRDAACRRYDHSTCQNMRSNLYSRLCDADRGIRSHPCRRGCFEALSCRRELAIGDEITTGCTAARHAADPRRRNRRNTL